MENVSRRVRADFAQILVLEYIKLKVETDGFILLLEAQGSVKCRLLNALGMFCTPMLGKACLLDQEVSTSLLRNSQCFGMNIYFLFLEFPFYRFSFSVRK